MAFPVRVLIAADYVLVRRGLTALDRNGEFQLLAEADNGYDVIELAARHRPDVVLLDVGMPRMQGAQSVSELRGARRTRQL
jgi:DNA-binding NarL/FixJ family response regulator